MESADENYLADPRKLIEVKDELTGNAGEVAGENDKNNEFEEPGRKPDHKFCIRVWSRATTSLPVGRAEPSSTAQYPLPYSRTPDTPLSDLFLSDTYRCCG